MPGAANGAGALPLAHATHTSVAGGVAVGDTSVLPVELSDSKDCHVVWMAAVFVTSVKPGVDVNLWIAAVDDPTGCDVAADAVAADVPFAHGAHAASVCVNGPF